MGRDVALPVPAEVLFAPQSRGGDDMQQPLHAQSEKEASLNRDLERLRKQLGILKSFLVAQPSGSTLVDFDLMTEEIISGVFGSSSPMVGTYDYAQIGEAAGIVNLPQEAPEGVTQATKRETLRQRQRNTPGGPGQGRTHHNHDWTASSRLHVNNGPLHSCGRDTEGSGTSVTKTEDRLPAGQRSGPLYWEHYRD